MAEQSLSEAVEEGDLRAVLTALQARLAQEVERVADEGFCLACKRGSSSIAPLSKQLADVTERLEALPSGEADSIVDDLATRRTERRAAAASSS